MDKPKLKFEKQHSAGGVVYRIVNRQTEIVLFWNALQEKETWSLPKGWLDLGEAAEATAVREVKEETGIEAVIEERIATINYKFQWEGKLIDKTVDYFLMKAVGGSVNEAGDEAKEARWFGIEEALKKLAYKNEKEVVKKAEEKLRFNRSRLRPPPLKNPEVPT